MADRASNEKKQFVSIWSLKMTKSEQKRAELERKVLCIFEATQELPVLGVKGIGKESIKRTLMIHDENLNPSSYAIQHIVEHFLDVGKIECVNPECKCGLRFRLAEYYCDNCDSDIFPVNEHCPNCKSDLTEFIEMVK